LNAGISRLDSLHYEGVVAFYANSPHYGVIEKLLMYGVFGGTPRYHALLDTSRPPAEEIVALRMQPRAVLENEVWAKLKQLLREAKARAEETLDQAIADALHPITFADAQA
jgi:hypothetical protein